MREVLVVPIILILTCIVYKKYTKIIFKKIQMHRVYVQDIKMLAQQNGKYKKRGLTMSARNAHGVIGLSVKDNRIRDGKPH